MNSYPVELLTQLAPVMFVAGLEIPSEQQQDMFTNLTHRLRDALPTLKSAIYQPEKTKSFHVIFVDKSIRFPPRKIIPDDPQYFTAHSPLSPLTPTSPLFPDGLIAPIWIRKHTNLVPSVFVLFLRIFELTPITPRSPLDPPDPDQEREREDEERRSDTDLSAEIAMRKKSTNERGIKLTVVLMATRRMLGASLRWYLIIYLTPSRRPVIGYAANLHPTTERSRLTRVTLCFKSCQRVRAR
jgi:hypothetical protein